MAQKNMNLNIAQYSLEKFLSLNYLTEYSHEFVINNIYLDLFKKELVDDIDLYELCIESNKQYETRIIDEFGELLNGIDVNEKKEIVYRILTGNFFNYKKLDNTNYSLSELILRLLKIESGDMLFDLGSGLGGFLASSIDFAEKNNILYKELLGMDVNGELINLSKVALSIIKSEKTILNLFVGDALDKSAYAYNKAYVFPPFGLKLMNFDKKIPSKMFEHMFSQRSNIEWLFVDSMLKGLVGNQRAVAICTMKSLYNDADKEYRNQLIKSGLLEGIIEFPSGMFEYMGIKICMLIFSKNNTNVKFVDATKCFDKLSNRFKGSDLPIEKIYNEYFNGNFMLKNIEEVLDANNLTPSHWMTKNKVVLYENGMKLSDCAKVFTGSQYTVKNFENMFTNVKTGYKILTSSDINEGMVQWDLLPNIDYKDTKFDKYAIKKNDVIVTSKSSKVKTVVVDIEPKEKILVTGGMLIVRPEIDKLDPTFLKIYLDSPEGVNVLKMIQKGSYIVTINGKDLANIVIPSITIDKQRKMAQKYNNKLTTLIAYKKEIEQLENSLNHFFINEMEENL